MTPPRDHLDKREWKDIIHRVRPEMTDEDFDEMWRWFVELQQAPEAQKGLN